MSLDATPKSAAANSYLTVLEADGFLGNRLYSSEWTAAVTATKEKALIWATTLIDRNTDCQGAVTDLAQRLSWPRVGVIDAQGRYVNQDVVPEQIKEATAELALFLVRRDRTAESDLLGQSIRSATVGPVSVTVADHRTEGGLSLFPDTVAEYLDPLATLKGLGSGGGMKVLKLTRA